MKRNELLILTGMSGAGRSTVAHSLEDLGWYVVDNLPPALLPALAKQSSDGELPALAVVVDVRGGKFFDDLNAALANLKNAGVQFRLLFLDASDQSLVARFESTRRPHPLQGSDRISDGIDRERADRRGRRLLHDWRRMQGSRDRRKRDRCRVCAQCRRGGRNIASIGRRDRIFERLLAV